MESLQKTWFIVTSYCIVSIGVIVLSWYPPGISDVHGESTEDLVPAVMDAAHRHSIKVNMRTDDQQARSLV